MLRSLRYQNPDIRDHLASQYAMGLLTPTVKRRVEKLIQQDADFEKEVILWQERLSPLNDIPEPVPAPDYVKQNVMAGLSLRSEHRPLKTSALKNWWQSLWVWQGIAMASLALFVIVAVQPFAGQTSQVAQLSYVAVMQSAMAGSEAPLVISAYGKTETQPSRLELRWNDRTPNENIEQATLWAVERDTGAVTKLTQLAGNTRSIDLNARQWQSVKNSLELVVTDGPDFDGDVLMRGICLQLATWET